MSFIRHLPSICLMAVMLVFMASCHNEENEDTSSADTVRPAVQTPSFSADSAYAFIEKQLDFGPRVPGSAAQKKAASWMQKKLAEYCDTVFVQNVQVKAGDGEMLPCINLIGTFNPQAQKRILLLAHWDSRPWADMDVQNKDKPILAADDGGSGVGVLLEVARAIKQQRLPPELGIDILFVDVEDFGKSEWGEDSYALGTQYWARNPHVPGYKASFGILLDMVGAKNAQFPLEGFSAKYAGSVQQEVWQAAHTAGYSSYFPFTSAPEITDDHFFVNTIAGIPTIDIINLSSNSRSGFPAHWHTHNDNMEVIDKRTLRAVGETLLQVIYQNALPAS